MNECDVPARNEEVKSRPEGFGMLLLMAGLPMLCINQDGEKIWGLCDGVRSVGDIVRLCMQEEGAEVEAETRQSVVAFLEEAHRLGLVSLSGPGGKKPTMAEK